MKLQPGPGWPRLDLGTLKVMNREISLARMVTLNGYWHRPDGDRRQDLDLASYGIEGPSTDATARPTPTWGGEPKAAFRLPADHYRG